MQYLRQSTASQAVLIGPFVDSTDGVTAETGLTIANTDIRLSSNGGNMFAKTSGGGTHDEAGWYTITLDATDSATVGRLQLSVAVAGALPVFAEYQVLEEVVFDALFAASANAFAGAAGATTLGSGAINAAAIAASALNGKGNWNIGKTGYSLLATTGLGTQSGSIGSVTTKTGYSLVAGTGLGNQTANITGNLSGSVGSVTGNVGGNVTGSVGSLVGHTVQTGDSYALANGATGFAAIDTVVDAILADTNELQTDDVPALIAALNNLSTADVDARLAAYDGATATALAAAFTEIKGATWSSGTDTLEEIRDRGDAAWITGGGGTAADIADAVWTELIADHSGVSGSTAESLAAAGSAGNPWITNDLDTYAVGTAGYYAYLNYTKSLLITGDTILTNSPVATNGTITSPLIIGDDYLSSQGRAFEWTIADPGYTAGTSTCKLGFAHPTAGSFEVPGTITDNGSTWTLSFNIAASDSSGLSEGKYEWSVHVADTTSKKSTKVRSSTTTTKVDWVDSQTTI